MRWGLGQNVLWELVAIVEVIDMAADMAVDMVVDMVPVVGIMVEDMVVVEDIVVEEDIVVVEDIVVEDMVVVDIGVGDIDAGILVG